MTETMNNFWQSFPTISLFGASFTEKKQVSDLINKARELAGAADEEARHAATAQKAMKNSDNENLRRNLSVIAVWHFRRAAQNYCEIAATFEKVENFRVKKKKREHFSCQAQQAVNRALENETAADLLEIQNRQPTFQN